MNFQYVDSHVCSCSCSGMHSWLLMELEFSYKQHTELIRVRVITCCIGGGNIQPGFELVRKAKICNSGASTPKVTVYLRCWGSLRLIRAARKLNINLGNERLFMTK